MATPDVAWSRLRRRWRGQAGSGPVTATGGVLMFLFFLFATVQASLHLYANSQAAAIALEGASRVAQATMDCDQAVAWVDQQVSGWPDVSGDCTIVGDTVQVEVAGASPAPALRILGSVVRLDSIRRTATMRLEAFR
jgi:hypothetical protein